MIDYRPVAYNKSDQNKRRGRLDVMRDLRRTRLIARPCLLGRPRRWSVTRLGHEPILEGACEALDACRDLRRAGEAQGEP